LRKQKIDLAGRKSWCESNDPDFAAKAADIVGLYLAPPENAIVICVDEKPSIQAPTNGCPQGLRTLRSLSAHPPSQREVDAHQQNSNFDCRRVFETTDLA